MRICVAGGGLAGTLLAWRLAARPGVRIRLLTGVPGAGDATAASGGLVRGFEPDPWNAAAAARSLLELYSDDTLREMAGYRETGSVYLPAALTVTTQRIFDDLAAELPGSLSMLDTAEAANRFGIAAPRGVVIVERRAGFIRPDRLRRRILALLPDLGVEVVPGSMHRLRQGPGAGLTYRTASGSARADVVVLATGPWTDRLLTAASLATTGLRTKAIQYSVHAADGLTPPSFVDEHSGLYGRPAEPGTLVLGLPTQRWGADPGRRQVRESEAREVADVARLVLPRLRLVAPVRTVAAVDAYTPDGRLRLRAVPGPEGLFTFTGGSGGAAKTALAATATATTELLGTAVPLSAGHRS